MKDITIFPVTGNPRERGQGSALTYPSTHNPPVHQRHPINTCTFASTMIPPSAPVTSGLIDSAPSMPSAEQNRAVAAKPPGKWSHSSQHGPTKHFTLLPHIFLHTPPKKFLQLPPRRRWQFCVHKVKKVNRWFR